MNVFQTASTMADLLTGQGVPLEEVVYLSTDHAQSILGPIDAASVQLSEAGMVALLESLVLPDGTESPAVAAFSDGANCWLRVGLDERGSFHASLHADPATLERVAPAAWADLQRRLDEPTTRPF